jgi:hypothetical protein
MERILLAREAKSAGCAARDSRGRHCGIVLRDQRRMAVPAKPDSFLIVDKIRDAVLRFREPRRSEQRFGLSLRVGLNALSNQHY